MSPPGSERSAQQVCEQRRVGFDRRCEIGSQASGFTKAGLQLRLQISSTVLAGGQALALVRQTFLRLRQALSAILDLLAQGFSLRFCLASAMRLNRPVPVQFAHTNVALKDHPSEALVLISQDGCLLLKPRHLPRDVVALQVCLMRLPKHRTECAPIDVGSDVHRFSDCIKPGVGLIDLTPPRQRA